MLITGFNSDAFILFVTNFDRKLFGFFLWFCGLASLGVIMIWLAHLYKEDLDYYVTEHLDLDICLTNVDKTFGNCIWHFKIVPLTHQE